jgi:hypothetical protein
VPCTSEAQARARALLLDYLSPEQRETFLATGHFDVVKTGSRRSIGMLLLGYPKFRVYRLSHSHHPVRLFTSAAQLTRSAPKYGYCIHSHGAAPPDDELLSMKLLLENDEARFLSIAYRFRSPEARLRLRGDRDAPEIVAREVVAALRAGPLDRRP